MKLPICKRVTGLRTENDPATSIYDKRLGGLRDLSACMDIDISDAGRPSRRKGMNRLFTEDSHSLFPVGDDYLLFCQDDGLYWTADLATKTGIRNINPGAMMSYCLVDNLVYYQNGFEKGIIDNRVSREWAKPATVVGRNVNRVFKDIPIGQRVAYYNGRWYIAQGKNVYYSEPHGPLLFAMGESVLQFESTIKMIRPVANGIYFSDSYDTWFASGTSPNEFNWRKVDILPALPWSDTEASGQMVMTNDGDYSFLSGKVETAFWMTQQGAIFGGPTGDIEKLTDAKIDLPGEYSGGACLVNGSTLIAVAQ